MAPTLRSMSRGPVLRALADHMRSRNTVTPNGHGKALDSNGLAQAATVGMPNPLHWRWDSSSMTHSDDQLRGATREDLATHRQTWMTD